MARGLDLPDDDGEEDFTRQDNCRHVGTWIWLWAGPGLLMGLEDDVKLCLPLRRIGIFRT